MNDTDSLIYAPITKTLAFDEQIAADILQEAYMAAARKLLDHNFSQNDVMKWFYGHCKKYVESYEALNP